MSKKVVIIVLVVVVIGLAVGYLVLADPNKQDVTTNNSQDTSNEQPTQESKQKTAETVSPGKYVEYEEGIIAKTKGTKVLFFHAPWCPQCRDLESDIQKRGVPDGVTIIKVDYDSSAALKQKYDVTLQTTVVLVDDEGNAVKKFVAYDDPTLASIERNLL